MKILVTGCAGFLGWNLCRRLLAEGHDVIGVDDLSTGLRARADDLHNVASASRADGTNAQFAWFRLDVRALVDGQFSSNILGSNVPPKEIYHLACPASPKFYQREDLRLHTFETALYGTHRILSLTKGWGAKLLIASTSEVYGDPEPTEQAETYWGRVNPVGPRSVYDEGKRAAETLAEHYWTYRGAKLRIARIFNTYGPGMRQDDGRAVPAFVDAALNGAPLQVYRGTQTRSFCYVDDLVDGLVALMNAKDDQVLYVPPIINLGNPETEIGIEALAKLIVELAGSASKVEVQKVPWDENDPRQRRPNITRARGIGWLPRVGLRVGLERTIRWFQEAYNYGGNE